MCMLIRFKLLIGSKCQTKKVTQICKKNPREWDAPSKLFYVYLYLSIDIARVAIHSHYVFTLGLCKKYFKDYLSCIGILVLDDFVCVLDQLICHKESSIEKGAIIYIEMS